jgi:O-antigen/teichoic acid export membrane protein
LAAEFNKVKLAVGQLLTGEAVALLCGFIRNIIVARFLSPGDFGIAATLAMTVSMIEMVTDFGVNRYLTRSQEGSANDWLSSANWLAILRGIFGMALLLAVAIPIASLMNMEGAVPAFLLIAIIPLIRSFSHNAMWLLQSQQRYKSYVVTQSGPQIATALLAYPVAVLIPNYYAMVWLAIINALLGMLSSHFTANEPYIAKYNKTCVDRLLKFGTPLLIDSLLMIFVLHGERVIIGNGYGKELVGLYSATLMLVWMPTSVVGRIMLSIGMPRFSSIEREVGLKGYEFNAANTVITIFAIIIGVLFSIAGDIIVKNVFGQSYRVDLLFCALLAGNNMLRMLRVMPSVVSLAESRPKIQVYANLVRLFSLVISFFLVRNGGSIFNILLLGAISELVALGITMHFLKDISYVSNHVILLAISALLLSILSAFIVGQYLIAANFSQIARLGFGMLLVMMLGGLFFYISRDNLNFINMDKLN